jgi:hypothetical protein
VPLSETGPYIREFGGVAPAANFLPKFETAGGGPSPCRAMGELWGKLPGYGDGMGTVIGFVLYAPGFRCGF